MVVYEELLDRNLDLALREGSMHFEKDSAVHKALRRIASRLESLGIPYVLVGGMAMFFHGYRRFTEDVGLLVTREGLDEIHRQLEGRGYLPPFTGSRHLRDTQLGVRIEFLVAGEFPGDGRPKPVAFPQPDECRSELEGIPCLELSKLIELKLASGMTNPGRLQDLADVQRLISTLDLPQDLSGQLHPFVQDKYRELWTAVRQNPPQTG